MSEPLTPEQVEIGDLVGKFCGDYSFTGTVVAAFEKLSGKVRYVVEDERGLLFIFNKRDLSIIRKGK